MRYSYLALLVLLSVTMHGQSLILRNSGNAYLPGGSFMIGRDSMITNGTPVTDTLLMFMEDNGAFRGGRLVNSLNWSPDSIGNLSVAFGYNSKAIGSNSLALGYQASARGISSFAAGQYTLATGLSSVALGSSTAANGSFATALGYYSDANGSYSFASGRSAEANGFASTAMGYFPDANASYTAAIGYYAQSDGNYSSAIGFYCKAQSAFETVIGASNTTYTPVSSTGWNDADRLFVVGNGPSSYQKSDALIVLKSGDTFFPDGSIMVGRDSLLANGESASDTLFFFDKAYGALRGGRLSNSTNYSPDMTGYFSLGFGVNTKASGTAAVCLGYNTEASGSYAIACGYSSLASGSYSTALGHSTQATDSYTTALGRGSVASVYGSTALGWASVATGEYSIAQGYFASTVGSYSISIGTNTSTQSGYETALGRHNTVYTPASPTTWNDTDRLFVIGNGTSSLSRSDALIILKNGDTQINGDLTTMHSNSSSTGGIHVVNSVAPSEVWRIYTSSSTGQLRLYSDDNGGTATAYIDDATGAYTANSDARLKKNIAPLENVLEKVISLQAKSFLYRCQDDGEKHSIGFIAQEVEPLFPELVARQDDWYGLTYDGFGVLAIKAVQEQQVIIEAQRAQLEDQQEIIAGLKNELQNLSGRVDALVMAVQHLTGSD